MKLNEQDLNNILKDAETYDEIGRRLIRQIFKRKTIENTTTVVLKGEVIDLPLSYFPDNNES